MASSGRREFMKGLAAAPFLGATVGGPRDDMDGTKPIPPNGSTHPLTGKVLPAWREGEFQVHFIYTGVAESMFWILPDGTSMLLDCGDHQAIERGRNAVWVLPSANRHAGEWIARYVERVNPNGRDVDYMMLSHHHSDHGGMEGWGAGVREWKGRRLSVSGFLQAADTLKFKIGFDRGWPDFNDPIPNERCDEECLSHIRNAIAYLGERDGLKMERFRVGAVNQVAMRHGAAKHVSFSITNITGNGKILCRDGSVRDLYAEMHDAKLLNENGMSLGLMVQYGPFRFFSAGDFSDTISLPDGSRRNIETELAKELEPVDVAKMNHHGWRSMPKPLVAALRARVWTACIWDKLHMTTDALENMCDRSAYQGPRLVAPNVFTPMRRIEEQGKAFMSDIAQESFEAGHVVLTVAPDGKAYNLAYVTADDESMKVTGAYDFVSNRVLCAN